MQHSRHRRSCPGGHAPSSRNVEQVHLGKPEDQPPHRLVRLLLTAGGAAAGLCLVLGLLAMMVALGARQHPSPRADSQPSGRAGKGRPDGNGAGRAVGRTLHELSGKGGRRDREVPIGGRPTWGLAWSFRCPPGRSGAFTVRASDRTDSRVIFRKSGERRTGLWWNTHDPGVHALHITSDCPWHARVVLPAKPHHRSAGSSGKHAGPPPNRGHGHRRKHGHGQGSGHSPAPRHSHKPKHSPRPDPSPGAQRRP